MFFSLFDSSVCFFRFFHAQYQQQQLGVTISFCLRSVSALASISLLVFRLSIVLLRRTTPLRKTNGMGEKKNIECTATTKGQFIPWFFASFVFIHIHCLRTSACNGTLVVQSACEPIFLIVNKRFDTKSISFAALKYEDSMLPHNRIKIFNSDETFHSFLFSFICLFVICRAEKVFLAINYNWWEHTHRDIRRTSWIWRSFLLLLFFMRQLHRVAQILTLSFWAHKQICASACTLHTKAYTGLCTQMQQMHRSLFFIKQPLWQWRLYVRIFELMVWCLVCNSEA